jgi:hypothetical protein
MTFSGLLTLHLLACAWMTGVIWLVQRLHYPMFEGLHTLSDTAFKDWMDFHTRRISPIVGPVMLMEAATAVLLLLQGSALEIPLWLHAINLLLLTAIFIATALGAVRAQGYQRVVVERLVRLNWIRTVSWTLRLGLWLFWLGERTFAQAP